MEKIIYSERAKNTLENLVVVLFTNEYFGFYEDAENYVNKIREFIKTIPYQPLKTCKKPMFGKYYARYDNPKSKMKYYITYSTFDDIYYIEDIISPKTPAYNQMMGL